MAVRIATKRARQEAIVSTFAAFGNVFGQCAYDKEYMKQMTSMDVPRRTIQDSTSYHHPRYDPHDLVKRPAPPKQATQEKNDSPFMKKLSESMTLPTPSASSSSTSTPVPEIPKRPSRKAKAATKNQSEAVNEPSASVTADLSITASSSGAPLEEKSDTVEGIAPASSQEEHFQDDQPLLRTYNRLRQRNDPKKSSKGQHKKNKK
ncbi:hypothetical protein LRAMOSA11467 [Lichtheimia ramosa]|uniref:Uncharacterized protein n=1 Tax=Lichtheimia ramosa TaxID=688394 RepID=A0A077WXP3_9FUNG|nr:hypothetical protein LRAMOSA11467 [Lichtheimia ramosa]